MSIHVKPNQEAMALYQRQNRKSTILSVLTAIGGTGLVALIFALFVLEPYLNENPTIITYAATLDKEDEINPNKVTTMIQRTPPAPPSAMSRVIAANLASPTAIPVPDVDLASPSMGFGDTDDFGTGFEQGSGTGGGFMNMPRTMSQRCSLEQRLNRLEQTGGTPECETAVERGLEWLKNTQRADGTWAQTHRIGYTGLGLLAFLGRCETPMSLKYGETVLSALMYLINHGMENGNNLSKGHIAREWPYEKAIAVYALAEAYTICQRAGIHIPGLEETVTQSGQFIIDHQHRNLGGWAYSYHTRDMQRELVDSSITAWHMQALKAMQHTGISFDGIETAVTRSTHYLAGRQHPSGGFAYRNPHRIGLHEQETGNFYTMTGGVTLSLQFWARSQYSAEILKGIRYIQNHSKFDYDTHYADMLGLYYESQAMINHGGQPWQEYNEMFRDNLLAAQNPDGSWKKPGTKSTNGIRAIQPEFQKNVHYRTCLAILTLEVYYRFLPGTSGR